jgi:hypothetical protein
MVDLKTSRKSCKPSRDPVCFYHVGRFVLFSNFSTMLASSHLKLSRSTYTAQAPRMYFITLDKFHLRSSSIYKATRSNSWFRKKFCFIDIWTIAQDSNSSICRRTRSPKSCRRSSRYAFSNRSNGNINAKKCQLLPPPFFINSL